MASIQDRFGTNASVDTSNPSDPVLQIKYSDLVSTGWDALQPGDETNADKWLTSVIILNHLLEETLTDEQHSVVVTPPFNPAIGQRNGIQVRGYSYTVTPYVPDTSGSAPDPDEI